MNKKVFPILKVSSERPRIIHKSACAHCPSAHFPPDPEAEDIKYAPRAIQIESCFPCGWRPNKLCKGYCDYLNITERDLESTIYIVVNVKSENAIV
jgi:hypothetical protein